MTKRKKNPGVRSGRPGQGAKTEGAQAASANRSQHPKQRRAGSGRRNISDDQANREERGNRGERGGRDERVSRGNKVRRSNKNSRNNKDSRNAPNSIGHSKVQVRSALTAETEQKQESSAFSSVRPNQAHEAEQSQAPRTAEIFVATENQDGQRLDNFLLGYLKGVPKTRIYRMIRKGEVRVNRSRCKPEQKLLTGDQVRIPPISVAEKLAPAVPGKPVLDRIKAAIIYESQDLLVLNKPSGLAVHGGSGLSFGVIEALRALFPDIQGLELVHRLDRDTSGCLMVAKNRKMLRWLHEQLRGDGVQKIYHAMVFGRWAASRRIVEAPLRKNELKSGERVVRVNAEGKPSETHYRVLSTNKRYSLVEARPITGRTHQIRVHCTHAGCPILGDDKYVSEKYADDPYTARPPRLMLHAYELRVRMPGKTSLAISAPYDEPFENVVTAQFGSGAHGH